MSVEDLALRFLALGMVDFGEGLSFIIILLICIDEDSADNGSSWNDTATRSSADGSASWGDDVVGSDEVGLAG